MALKRKEQASTHHLSYTFKVVNSYRAWVEYSSIFFFFSSFLVFFSMSFVCSFVTSSFFSSYSFILYPTYIQLTSWSYIGTGIESVHTNCTSPMYCSTQWLCDLTIQSQYPHSILLLNCDSFFFFFLLFFFFLGLHKRWTKLFPKKTSSG